MYLIFQNLLLNFRFIFWSHIHIGLKRAFRSSVLVVVVVVVVMMVVVVFNVPLLSVRWLSSKYSRVMYTKQITDITP